MNFPHQVHYVFFLNIQLITRLGAVYRIYLKYAVDYNWKKWGYSMYIMDNCKNDHIQIIILISIVSMLSFPYTFCSQIASPVPRLRVSRAAGGHAAAMPQFLVIQRKEKHEKTYGNVWKMRKNYGNMNLINESWQLVSTNNHSNVV